MPIDWIYKDAMPVGTSATLLLMTGATRLMMSKQPPPRHPMVHHFVRVGLCRAHIAHNDPFQPSSYQLESTGLCRAQEPMGCQLTRCTETLCLLELPHVHS